MLLKACLNGATTREQHPAVPITPAELAAEADAAVEAGAGALHLHPRNGEGLESLAAGDVGAAIAAIRGVVADVRIGVSTGLWMTAQDPEARLAAIRGWAELEPRERPDFASVNLSEGGFGAVADALAAVEVGVEAGVWTVDDAVALAGEPWRDRLVRILVEPQERDDEGAAATAAAIEQVLDAARLDGSRLHHGSGTATWTVIGEAVAAGRDVRIGLEDTVLLPDGSTPAGNAELVHAAARLMYAAGGSWPG